MTQSNAPGVRAANPLVRRLNLPFLGSLGLVVGSYVVALMALRLVIDDNEVAATLSAMVIGAGPRVQRELEQRLPRAPTPLVSFDGYRLHWWVLLTGGILAIWIAEAARIVIGVRGGPATDVSASVRDALTLLPVAAAVAIGILAGARSDRWPVFVAIAAIVIGHLLSVATSDRVVAFATASDGAALLCQPQPVSPPGTVDIDPCAEVPPDPRSSLFGTGIGASLLSDELPILVLAGMAALWWGSWMRYAFYLGHVAGSLDAADRAALLEIATEERRRRTQPDEVAPGE